MGSRVFRGAHRRGSGSGGPGGGPIRRPNEDPNKQKGESSRVRERMGIKAPGSRRTWQAVRGAVSVVTAITLLGSL